MSDNVNQITNHDRIDDHNKISEKKVKKFSIDNQCIQNFEGVKSKLFKLLAYCNIKNLLANEKTYSFRIMNNN